MEFYNNLRKMDFKQKARSKPTKTQALAAGLGHPAKMLSLLGDEHRLASTSDPTQTSAQ